LKKIKTLSFISRFDIFIFVECKNLKGLVISTKPIL